MTGTDKSQLTEGATIEKGSIDRAFGAGNRKRLIDQYFIERMDSTSEAAWEHIYRLLLWSDPTTGLAHCYESDKSQPGKPWYSRSLAFHDWLSTELGIEPLALANEIDWLFMRACEDLSVATRKKQARLVEIANKQRQRYLSRGLPEPGADPELAAIIGTVLAPCFAYDPSPSCWSDVTRKAREFLAVQNKRKNLVGEGFEDVLAQVVRRTCGLEQNEVLARSLLHQIPGFNRSRQGAKENKVDLAIIRPTMRTLVTAKWSVRADREKQFPTEYDEYISAESLSQKFQYVFVTNEFDPARLMRACESLYRNSPMFDYVVHISTDAIRAAYSGSIDTNLRDDSSWKKVLSLIDRNRLISIDQWLRILANQI